MPTEVEAKYRAAGPDRLVRLASAETLGDAALGTARTVEEVDTYLDTADGALSAEGWACRLRARNGVVRISLKGAADGPEVGGIHRRPEVEGPATASPDPGAWPPSEARAIVDRLRDGAPLAARLVLRQVRTERTVTLGGAPLALLSLDEVTVHAGGAERGRFHVVELELDAAAHGREAELATVARSLAAEPGLRPDPQTKLEHALELIGER